MGRSAVCGSISRRVAARPEGLLSADAEESVGDLVELADRLSS